MVYSYQWLKEYVDFNLSPEKLMTLLTLAGLPIEDFSSLGNDTIFECEIPANRGDLLSILGLAREIAAISGKRGSLKFPVIFSGEETDVSFRVNSSEPSLCPFYSARVIEGVKVGPSPDWLKERLIKAKIRPINNVVDITNLVLLETGQPLHAFDRGKIEGEIIVRCAIAGERLRTLDGELRKLDKSMLIVADKKKPLAIAGVMGGKESEVTDVTADILLESAYFAPSSIRKTAKSFNLSTESSFRFERGVDPAGALFALDRASWLIKKVCKGKIGQLNRIGKFSLFPLKLKLRKGRVFHLLGIEISPKTIKNILNSSGFKNKEKKNSFEIVVPSFRQDIRKEVDIIEEIARLYGYEKIPAGIPEAKITPFSENKEEEIASLVKRILISFGLDEVVTSNFSSFPPLEGSSSECIKFLNPLTVEQNALRTNLFSSLLSAFSYNTNRGNKKMGFFELGKTYFRQGASFQEKLILSIGLYNSGDFLHLKGILEELLERTGISDYKIGEFNHKFLEEKAVGIFLGEEFLGYFGKARRRILSSMKLKGEVYLAELDFELLAKLASFTKELEPLPKYPGVKRDLAIVAAEKLSWEKIKESIEDTSRLIKKVELFDLYKGKGIPSGYRGLAVSLLYQSGERTLTKGEVDELQGKVGKRLKQRFKIEIRGK